MGGGRSGENGRRKEGREREVRGGGGRTEREVEGGGREKRTGKRVSLL